MFQRCLICTDLSDGLHRLRTFIPHLAKSGLKQIVFVHSVPLWEEGSIPRIDKQKIKEVQSFFAPILAQDNGEVEVKVEVLSGRPLDTIPKVVQQYQSEVIFMGTPIRSLLEEKIFGSTTMEIAKATQIPLLILRPQLISTYTCEELALRCEHLWRYLLIPYNDQGNDQYLIEQIKQYVATNPQTIFKQCLLCWVIDEGGRSEAISSYHHQEAEAKLQQVQQELEGCGLEVVTEVREGNHLHEILDLAIEYDISAIATSFDYQQRNLLKWTVPDLANEILHHSWFPVLFFSPRKG